MKMDVGLYREDEQFSFASSPYMETCSNDSTSFTTDQNELFEIRPMPQPPNDIFELHNDDIDNKLLNSVQSNSAENSPYDDDTREVSLSTKGDLQKIVNFQDWQHPINSRVELPTSFISEEKMELTNKNATPYLQVFANNSNIPQTNLTGIKIQGCSNSIRSLSLSESSESSVNGSCKNRRESESSDLLSTSFSSTELTNFDIEEYVFEENKQAKACIDATNVKTELKQIKKEPIWDEDNFKPAVNVSTPRRVVKAAVKKIDLKAQKYIIDKDNTKTSFSEDEGDVDIETVSEEENSPILEAGDLTDLLEQFEATEVKNKEHITNKNVLDQNHHSLSLNIKVEIKTEKAEIVNEVAKPSIKVEPKVKRKQSRDTQLVHTKQEQVSTSIQVKVEPGKISPLEVKAHDVKPHEQLYINDMKIYTEPDVKYQETTTSSKTLNVSSSRQILDSLPQELINRIKESGKRKPITVIQAIPNNRKRSKIQATSKPLPLACSEAVHLDHDYCSSKNISSNLISKKDSGFVSSEEDDRSIISRQPTVKNADGTLMVSLLKANTIRQLDPVKNERKKLNLEEYKKRRNGLLTPKINSQNCSPNTSTCSSPLPEDEHEKMLKHQEKLRKMAQEVLSAAPKAEKRTEPPNSSLLVVPGLIPLSPVASISSSQPESPAVSVTLPIKTETVIKPEFPVKREELAKIEVDIPEKVPRQLVPPKIPPNLELKVLVSFGVNTDIRIAKNEDPLAPVEKLQEIKPLLEKVSSKISENSLIASVIENIPKLIDKNEKADDRSVTKKEDNHEHGEYKQFIYLEKDRVRCEMKDTATQTNISLIEQTKRGRIRRRVSTSSSCSSYKSKQSAFPRRSRKCSVSSSSSRSSVSSSCSTTSSLTSPEYSSRNSSRLSSYSRSRSRSPKYKRRRDISAEREHLNAVEERRIIYVGRILTGTTKEDLGRKFQKFGPINKISLHFRDIGENYGFVTFKYKEDAHEAYEHGNDDPSYPCYKISFGGRREFCKAAYSDLDNISDDAYYQSQTTGDSYDKLLKEALEKLKKRKV